MAPNTKNGWLVGWLGGGGEPFNRHLQICTPVIANFLLIENNMQLMETIHTQFKVKPNKPQTVIIIDPTSQMINKAKC